jgi:Flp pilus assembly protein TadG
MLCALRQFEAKIGLLGTMRAMLGGITKHARHFRQHENGSAVLSLGLSLVPITICVGAAVDYSMAGKAKAKLDAVADAAALSAVDHQAISGSAVTAQNTAQSVFNALAQGIANVTVTGSSATVTDGTSGRTAVVSYTATKPNLFMGLIGFSTTTLTGSSTAAAGLSSYIDFYMLLDNTPSMGVGATPGDIATMVTNTPDQCAFACHDLQNPNNYYNLAKKLGVTMRFDVVRDATQSLMDTALSTETLPNQYRVSVYTFGASSAKAGLTNIVSLTSDLAIAKTQIGTMDIMTVNGQNQFNDQDTNYDGIFPAVNSAIPAAGSGTRAAPQKVLFFVSDGVADEYNSNSCSQKTVSNGRCQEPIDLSLCTTLKNRGVLIAVLYTTYLPLPTNSWYNQYIKPFAGQISPTMQSCASPGLFFEVSPTQGISQAMTALFQNAVMTARLTR